MNFNLQGATMRKPILLALGLALAASPLAASTWTLDQSHTEIAFETTHLGITKVRGRFTQADAKITLNEKDLSKSRVEITIPVKSVSTNNEKRDGHLLNDDFFAADKNPNITFKSTKIAKDGDAYALTGNLTIRGVTKPVTLKAQISEPVATDWGFNKRAISLRGSINRFDYGVAWGNKTKAGSLIVAEKVDLIIDGQIDQKK
jgi:polyisoprenoid-binding protein YceI